MTAPTPHYTDPAVTLYAGDCVEVMAGLPDNSVDAVVTDPPYGLGFMGKQWDNYASPRQFQAWCQTWADECLRVLKPGGHLLAFGGARTYHRLACAVEDAGFEIRDSITWVHANGFPKSLNVSKDTRFCQCQAVPYSHDVAVPGVRQGVHATPQPCATGGDPDLLAAVQRQGAWEAVGDLWTPGPGRLDGHESVLLQGEDERPEKSGVEGRGDVQAGEGQLRRPEIRPVSARPADHGEGGRLRDGASPSYGAMGGPSVDAGGVRESLESRPARQPAGEPRALPQQRGSQDGRGRPVCARCGKPEIPAGLGTALKPASEPIVVARKPLAGTVAANVQQWGTGALNIDATRVGTAPRPLRVSNRWPRPDRRVYGDGLSSSVAAGVTDRGRWPPNVVLTHSADCQQDCAPGCPVAELDRQSGVTRDGVAGAPSRGFRTEYVGGEGQPAELPPMGYGGFGGASRFPTFRYAAKAPGHERPRIGAGTAGGTATAHPTVKPLGLIRWLTRLVVPPGGTCLDPCAGSGTTGEACVIEGFRCILVEREPDYLPLIVGRLSKPIQPDMFG